MQETAFEEVRRASTAMYLALEAVNQLHNETELEGKEVCAHCSAIADGLVAYPCATIQVLFTDFFEATEPFEPSESEELSS